MPKRGKPTWFPTRPAYSVGWSPYWAYLRGDAGWICRGDSIKCVFGNHDIPKGSVYTFLNYHVSKDTVKIRPCCSTHFTQLAEKPLRPYMVIPQHTHVPVNSNNQDREPWEGM